MVMIDHFCRGDNLGGKSYPYDGVHLRGGDLLGPLYGRQDLLLVLWWGKGVGEEEEEEGEGDDESETETRGGEFGGEEVERLDQYQ